MLTAFVCTFCQRTFFPLSNYFSDNKTGKLFVIKPTAGLALPLPSHLYLGEDPTSGPKSLNPGSCQDPSLSPTSFPPLPESYSYCGSSKKMYQGTWRSSG